VSVERAGTDVDRAFAEINVGVAERQSFRYSQASSKDTGKQISILAIGTASSIRNALAIPPPDVRDEGGRVPNTAEMRQMLIVMIEDDLLRFHRFCSWKEVSNLTSSAQ